MLKTESLSIAGKTFTLSEKTLYIEFRRQELLDKAIAENANDTDVARKLMRVGYVNLSAAVIEGEPPTFEDVLYRVSTDDTSKWSEAARRLNPQWFPTPPQPSPNAESANLERDAAADAKKKKRTRGRSTKN